MALNTSIMSPKFLHVQYIAFSSLTVDTNFNLIPR